MSESCQLCERETKRGTTKHHLIPRTCHSNKWFQKNFSREQMRETVPLCHDCHAAIHKFVPREKELGRHYHSLDLLLAHPEIAKFDTWIVRQK